MWILNAIKFLVKSFISVLISSICLVLICGFIFKDIDLSFLDDKPQIEEYNISWNMNLSTNEEYIIRYSDTGFTDGKSLTIFKMKETKKEDFINEGFIESNEINEILIEIYYIHASVNISYKHMLDKEENYLILRKENGSKKIYFIFDSKEEYLYILEIF